MGLVLLPYIILSSNEAILLITEWKLTFLILYILNAMGSYRRYSVGYFSAGGDMDMCIALRTAVLKDETLYVQAGGGVVWDSDPEAEYEETVNKSRAIRKAAEDAGRFERGGNG